MISISGGVDTNVPGKYELVYAVKDFSGNEAKPEIRKIIVNDTIPPVLEQEESCH